MNECRDAFEKRFGYDRMDLRMMKNGEYLKCSIQDTWNGYKTATESRQKEIDQLVAALEDVDKQFSAYEKDGKKYSESSIYLKIGKVRDALAKYREAHDA